jgi:ATP-binding protein involved in chromosome partitioning
MIDPRLDIVERRLQPVRRVVVFASAKGGVGKSVCAVAVALALARDRRRVGLLDLDFQGASAHVLLRAPLRFPEEEGGVLPLQLPSGPCLMSFAAFSREHPVPLRGGGVSEAILELLAITVWPRLDALIVDMPPGIGDEVLDLLRLVPRAEFVVIATPSPLVLTVVERLLKVLQELRAPLLGILGNMVPTGSPASEGNGGLSGLEALAARQRTSLLGFLPLLPDLEDRFADGDPLSGALGGHVFAVARRLVP